MKKVTLILMVTVFMLTGNVFAQLSNPVIVDQLSDDCEWHYYVHNSLGPRIAVDEDDAVHVVYRKNLLNLAVFLSAAVGEKSRCSFIME